MIYAHRGANREAPENTRTAFDRALEYAIDGLETDIQLSHDGMPVLWHDRYLGKLGHPNKQIDDYDYHELLQLNFVAQIAANGFKESIMSLPGFVEAYRRRCRLLLEIKNWDGEDESRQKTKVRKTLELTGTSSDREVIVSSFHLPSLVYANQLMENLPLVYNCEKDQMLEDAEHMLVSHPFLYGLCLHKNTLEQAMVQMLRRHNKLIAVYTCNSDMEIRRALDIGVDILISDMPQKAMQIRDA
jgi:glycerophosphoryl diester phosphodiesterase